VVAEVKMNGWDGKDLGDEKNPKLQWSFAGALLYAVTVITTIGKLSTLCFSLSVRVVLTLESKLPSIKSRGETEMCSQTDIQTDTLIAILRHSYWNRSHLE